MGRTKRDNRTVASADRGVRAFVRPNCAAMTGPAWLPTSARAGDLQLSSHCSQVNTIRFLRNRYCNTDSLDKL
jgi:hypothetical protein